MSKLRNEMKGLDNWPMSSSYPQESGEREFKEVMRSLQTRGRKEQEKTNTSVELGPHTEKTLIDSCSNTIWSTVCGLKDENSDIDQVDGGGEDILKPLVKLYFLKIFFIDIGISFGDVVTDLAQGINLIFDHNWNIQWTTFHYGLIVLVLIWLPLLPLAIHIVSFRQVTRYCQKENKLRTALMIVASVIFFPLLPTFMYVRILMMKRGFASNRNKLKFLELEEKATEIKSLVGSIESPLQFILMMWLMLRGILTLPWDQPLSSSCVEDSLGRVACLPSIPMLSMLFSLLSIIKSVFDLNMFAVTSASMNSLTKSKVCQHLLLCFFPFYLCNILFRLPAYAFILCFIDIWSIIPAVVLFILQLALCGLFFIRPEQEEQELPLDNLMRASMGTINEASTDDRGRTEEVDGTSGLVWDGGQWISRSMMGTTKQRLPVEKEATKVTEETDESNKMETSEDKLSVKTLIDEINTPIFFNAVAGCFFPCVYSVAARQNRFTMKEINDFVMWKMKVMMFQSFLFNVSILIILFCIFILVTFIQSFNYKTNILNFFWFCAVNCYFVILGVPATLWSLVIYPRRKFPLLEKTESGEEEVKDRQMMRRRHLTGESNTDSVYSASTSIIEEVEGLGRDTNNKVKRIYCLLVTLIVLLPSLLGVLVYNLQPNHKIYLVQVNQSSSEIFTQVIGSYDYSGLDQSINNAIVKNFSLMIDDLNLESKMSGNNWLLYIDQNKEDQWRMSSPRVSLRSTTAEDHIVEIRKVDFDLVPLDLSGEIGLTRNLQDLSPLIQQLAGCSEDPVIHMADNTDQDLPPANKKYLFDNGSVIEVKNIAWKCFIDGHPCNLGPGLGHHAQGDRIGIICGGERVVEQIWFENSDGGLEQHQTRLLNGRTSSYCCHNASHIIRFYGDQCDNLQLGYLHKICTFSLYFDEGTCGFDGLQTRTQMCKVYGLNCVLKRSFKVFCRTQLPLEGCLLDEYSCA